MNTRTKLRIAAASLAGIGLVLALVSTYVPGELMKIPTGLAFAGVLVFGIMQNIFAPASVKK